MKVFRVSPTIKAILYGIVWILLAFAIMSTWWIFMHKMVWVMFSTIYFITVQLSLIFSMAVVSGNLMLAVKDARS